MSRPRNVRCENCCYWDAKIQGESGVGWCCRSHATGEETLGHHWCGEFRAEWPGSETTVRFVHDNHGKPWKFYAEYKKGLTFLPPEQGDSE